MNQIGLAFTILPAGLLMVLQYSIFKMGEYLFIHQLQNILIEKLSIPLCNMHNLCTVSLVYK